MMDEPRAPSLGDVWIFAGGKLDTLEESTLGLIAEARRFLEGRGTVTVVVLERGAETDFSFLDGRGVDRVLCIQGLADTGRVELQGREVHDETAPPGQLPLPRGEVLAETLTRLAQREQPAYILMAHDLDSMDLAPRLAASLEAGLVTRAVDFQVNREGRPTAVRPIADGYLFERVELLGPPPYIVSFLPSVLTVDHPRDEGEPEVVLQSIPDACTDVKTRVISVTAPREGEVDLEEADTVVAGGRGVGKGDAFQIVHELAEVLDGTVGGTRPVVDWGTLPFERQIGQTGKTVSPRLLIACGISGANEYTAGMDKSQVVIAVNSDPSARIFRFADLGVVGDLHEVLPLLIQRIKEIKAPR